MTETATVTWKGADRLCLGGDGRTRLALPYDLIMRSDDMIVGLDGCSVHCVHPDKVQLVLDATLPTEQLARASGLFKLLGDLTRSRLLFALLEAGELCVCDLAAATGTQEATVSQSLRMLRASGVVTGRRQGRLVFYRLADAHVRMLLDLTREHIAHDADGASGATASARMKP